MKKIAYILKIFIHVSLFSENNKFQRGPSHKFALKNNFFAWKNSCVFEIVYDFAFCCFEICKGINFRKRGQKTRKTRKFLPAKVLMMTTMQSLIYTICSNFSSPSKTWRLFFIIPYVKGVIAPVKTPYIKKPLLSAVKRLQTFVWWVFYYKNDLVFTLKFGLCFHIAFCPWWCHTDLAKFSDITSS